jgi:hypothetical protein
MPVLGRPRQEDSEFQANLGLHSQTLGKGREKRGEKRSGGERNEEKGGEEKGKKK